MKSSFGCQEKGQRAVDSTDIQVEIWCLIAIAVDEDGCARERT